MGGIGGWQVRAYLNRQQPTSVAGYLALATQQADLQELIGEILFHSTLKEKLESQE